MNELTDEQWVVEELIEVWRPIEGPAIRYEVSSFGRVRNAVSRRVMRPRDCGDGHITAWMRYPTGGRGVYVHRLVLIAFRGPAPDGYIGRHLNGDPSDNRLLNLAWGTPLDNARDSIAHGRQVRGESNGRSKLTSDQVRAIRRLYVPRSRHANTRALARRYGVNANTIRKIVNGQRWAHVSTEEASQ